MKLEDFLGNESYNYDFKNESPTDRVKNEENAIKKFFKFKLDSSQSSFDCDCCELAKEIYVKLWNLSAKDLNFYDCDTMNSFYRIYRLLLISYDNYLKDDYWNKAGIVDYHTRYKWLLKEEVYEHYKKINENESVKKFAKLTHSIGNFTLVPKGFNIERNTLLDDYWDLTLQYFKDFLEENTFVSFAEKYYYEDYIDGSNVNFYWKDHSLIKKALPTYLSYENIISIIEKINDLIEARGKKLLYRLK
ncbi:hypothetical protein MPH47_13150 [Psychrobacillus psychrodurans]|uniref:hypothetical protein n=1 Tax=Psychrobacillus psychrodurans TaxID=126157 RepID=UPI001F4E5D10|nr:hypothetical protein [Psychrobacillus psychrodurans]MCK1998145.1 hypothetical protein [Psychrobacillus psychrodurans]